MKKKLIYVMAVLVVVLSTILLSGCTPNVPDEFITKLLDSNECTIVVGEGEEGYTYTFDNDKIAYKSLKEEYYMVFESDCVKKYSKKDKEPWTYEKIEDKTIIDNLSIKNIKEDLIKKGGLYTEDISKQFNANYEKKDKVWVDKKTGNNKVEISNGSLITYFNGKRAYTYILKGYVIIPNEALQADKNK